MKLLCPDCNKMPFVHFSFSQEKIVAIIICKCGRKFHDLMTFLFTYTDILTIEQEREKNSLEKIITFPKISPTITKINSGIYDIIESRHLIGFCNTCFENIYSDHNGNDNVNFNYHKKKKHCITIITKESQLLITEEEFNTIGTSLKKAEDKVLIYLPEMRDMLINATEKPSEKKEIKNIAEFNLDRNNFLLKFLQLVFQIYSIHKDNPSNLQYQMIYNLKQNSDYNLNKYNLDLKTIDKERFVSFLKSCIILCCNSFINKLYLSYSKEKEELKKMILAYEPLEVFVKDKNKNQDFTEMEIEELTENIDEMIKSNSSLYFGEKCKKNNLAYGRGFLYCSSGSHYLGYFKNDFFKSGFGKSVNKNGNYYLGYFKNGLANGYGMFVTKGGNVYQGEWIDNKLNGFGYITWENGQIYNGDMNNGIFNGIGELSYLKGNLFRGELKDGKMDGVGRVQYKNGKVYEGEFKLGSKNGFGSMIWPSKEKYEGLWINDSFNFGEYFWPNGNIYLGNFSKESVNGFGTFYNSFLGTIETGEWKDGRRVDINHKDTVQATRYLSFL